MNVGPENILAGGSVGRNCVVGNGNDSTSGVPVELAKGEELFDKYLFGGGIFGNCATDSSIERLVDVNKATRKRGDILERFVFSRGKSDVKLVVFDAKPNYIDGH